MKLTNRKTVGSLVAIAIIVSAGIAFSVLRDRAPNIESASTLAQQPRIRPDYSGTVIPPNIAPLNFAIEEPAQRYHARISSEQGQPIGITSRNGEIRIPIKAWKKLLSVNQGNQLHFDVFVQSSDGQWTRFKRISNTIAHERIDSYVAYRLITSIYGIWSKRGIGLYQRNLENFEERRFAWNKTFDGGCVNCHTFYKNSPDKMLFHLRSKEHGKGSVVHSDNKPYKLNPGTDFNGSAIYMDFGPTGKTFVFSTNDIIQFFHTKGEQRDVYDLTSDLAIYSFETNTVTTSPKISDPNRQETYPTWAPDGKYLYFCGGPQLPVARFEEVKYDLMRVGYDRETDTWGQLETVLSSEETGLSITHPKISPGGRFLVFCMCKYGSFSIFRPSSDLYIMDLSTGKYRPLEILNSDWCESWHCWSSNGKWMVFSSKRRDGLFARPYLTYIDQDGKASKPLVMPQEDPRFYDSLNKTYNLPQLVTAPIKLTERASAKAITEGQFTNAKLDSRIKPRKYPAQGVNFQKAPGN